jgi:hypothetical protein
MKEIKCVWIAIVICLLLSSCGTIFGNKTRKYNVMATKDISYYAGGSKIVVKQGKSSTITKNSGQDITITSLDGENSCSITDTFCPGAILNLTNPLAWIIDAVTGSISSNPTTRQAQAQCGFININ